MILNGYWTASGWPIEALNSFCLKECSPRRVVTPATFQHVPKLLHFCVHSKIVRLNICLQGCVLCRGLQARSRARTLTPPAIPLQPRYLGNSATPSNQPRDRSSFQNAESPISFLLTVLDVVQDANMRLVDKPCRSHACAHGELISVFL